MTKLNQIRYTTYSDPRSLRPSKGNLISLNGDESYLLNNQEITLMEVVSKSPPLAEIAIGDVGSISLGFLGTASNGFKFSIFIRHRQVIVTLFESDISRTYSDRTIQLEVPAIFSPESVYQVFYSIESADGTTAPRVGPVATEDQTPMLLDVAGALSVGRVIEPVGVGTVVRTQDGGVVKYQGVSSAMKYGTSGSLVFTSGNSGHQDFYPYAIFSIPNTASDNFVLKATLGKSFRAELGVTPVAPSLILINPATTTPVIAEQTYLNIGAGINIPEPTWAFIGAFNGGATVIQPSNVNVQLGTVEYDIPDSISGACLALFSSGLPYVAGVPYRDNFGGVDYRNKERSMAIIDPVIYVKSGAAVSTQTPFREIVFDLGRVVADSAAISFNLNAKLNNLALFGDISNKVITRTNAVSYVIKPSQAGYIEVAVNVGTQNFKYTGTVEAGTTPVTVLLVASASNVQPTTTLDPSPVTFAPLIESGPTYRQYQTINPWESREFIVSLSAWAGVPTKTVAFNSSEIRVTATGLPPGTTLNMNPMSTVGSTISYKGVLSNNSTSPIAVGTYYIKMNVSRVSGVSLSITSEIFRQAPVTVYIEPKIYPTTTMPPAGYDPEYNVYNYSWTQRAFDTYQIKGKVGGVWGYTRITDGAAPKVGVDSDGFVYAVGFGVLANPTTTTAGYNFNFDSMPFLFESGVLKEGNAAPYPYVETNFYIAAVGGINGSPNFFTYGEANVPSPATFTPSTRWVNFQQRSNNRSAQDLISKTEQVSKFMNGRNPETNAYFTRSKYIDFLIYPRDTTTVGLMNYQGYNISTGLSNNFIRPVLTNGGIPVGNPSTQPVNPEI